MSIIFKPAAEKQPWVMNLVLPKIEDFIQMTVNALQALGCIKKDSIQKQKPENEESDDELKALTQEEVNNLKDEELIENLEIFEQEVMAIVQEASEMQRVEGGNLSNEDKGEFKPYVETLFYLYERAIRTYRDADSSENADMLEERMNTFAARDIIKDIREYVEELEEEKMDAGEAEEKKNEAKDA